MRQHRTVGCWITVGFAVLALACTCFLIWGLWSNFDCLWATIWGPKSLVAKAEECLERGDYDNALRFANRAVQCRPDRKLPYGIRAMVLEKRGEYREAVQDYTTLVSRGDFLQLTDRGRLYEKMGELDKAVTDYCRVLRSGRTKSGGSSHVRFVALSRVMGPDEYDTERHPDAVAALLKFINEAIVRQPDNRELRECRDMIRRGEFGD